jgi:hypothetical protein
MRIRRHTAKTGQRFPPLRHAGAAVYRCRQRVQVIGNLLRPACPGRDIRRNPGIAGCRAPLDGGNEPPDPLGLRPGFAAGNQMVAARLLLPQPFLFPAGFFLAPSLIGPLPQRHGQGNEAYHDFV